MNSAQIVQGRLIHPKDIEQIRSLIEDHPSWSRHRLSLELVHLWNWRNRAGLFKDMAARELLLKLDERGEVKLPLRRQMSPKARAYIENERVGLFPEEEAAELKNTLSELIPLQVELIKKGHPKYSQFSSYLARYHYLGHKRHVGENLSYLMMDRHGRDLACVVFGAAAWRTKPRDQWIEWDDLKRAQNLSYLTNNTRFLILPWVHVKHLASHILGLLTRRLTRDWQERYAHSVFLVETFVEQNRFKGTCYKAANWILLGETQGRSRQDRYNTLRVPVKDIYVYPLCRDFRKRLKEDCTIPNSKVNEDLRVLKVDELQLL